MAFSFGYSASSTPLFPLSSNPSSSQPSSSSSPFSLSSSSSLFPNPNPSFGAPPSSSSSPFSSSSTPSFGFGSAASSAASAQSFSLGFGSSSSTFSNSSLFASSSSSSSTTATNLFGSSSGSGNASSLFGFSSSSAPTSTGTTSTTPFSSNLFGSSSSTSAPTSTLLSSSPFGASSSTASTTPSFSNLSGFSSSGSTSSLVSPLSSSLTSGFSFPSGSTSISASSSSLSAPSAPGFSYAGASTASSASSTPAFSFPGTSTFAKGTGSSASSTLSSSTPTLSSSSSSSFSFGTHAAAGLQPSFALTNAAVGSTSAASSAAVSSALAAKPALLGAGNVSSSLFSTVSTTTSASTPATTAASSAAPASAPALAFPSFGASSSATAAPTVTPAGTSTLSFSSFGTTSAAASSGTSSSIPSFSLSTKTPAAVSSSQPQSTAAAPLFGVPASTSTATTTSSASSAAQTSSSLVVASSSGTTSAVGAAVGSAPKLPSESTGKTVEEIINEWNAELQERTGKFRKHANAIAEWDKRILQNHDVLKLETEVAKVVETQANLERQLELIETHQQEVDKSLQSMEEEAERTYKDERGVLLDDEAALTRDAMYKQAEFIERELEQVTEQIKSIIRTLIANQAGEPEGTDGMNPLDVVVRILNNLLSSLMWIDEKDLDHLVDSREFTREPGGGGKVCIPYMTSTNQSNPSDQSGPRDMSTSLDPSRHTTGGSRTRPLDIARADPLVGPSGSLAAEPQDTAQVSHTRPEGVTSYIGIDGITSRIDSDRLRGGVTAPPQRVTPMDPLIINGSTSRVSSFGITPTVSSVAPVDIITPPLSKLDIFMHGVVVEPRDREIITFYYRLHPEMLEHMLPSGSKWVREHAVSSLGQGLHEYRHMRITELTPPSLQEFVCFAEDMKRSNNINLSWMIRRLNMFMDYLGTPELLSYQESDRRVARLTLDLKDSEAKMIVLQEHIERTKADIATAEIEKALAYDSVVTAYNVETIGMLFREVGDEEGIGRSPPDDTEGGGVGTSEPA